MSAHQDTAHRYAQLLRGEYADIQLAKGIWWRAGDADRRDMTRWQDAAIERAAGLIRSFETAGDGTAYGGDGGGEDHVTEQPRPVPSSPDPENPPADPGETWANPDLPTFPEETQDVIASAGDHIAAVSVHSEQLDTQTVGQALQGLADTIDLIVEHNAHLRQEDVVKLLSPYHRSAQRGRMLIEQAADEAADGNLSRAAQLLWHAKEELERLRAG